MPILSKIILVESEDGVQRALLKWKNRKYIYFATIDEVRDLARECLLLIQDSKLVEEKEKK